MSFPTTIERIGRHGDAFGFRRLPFASLAIVSRAPELRVAI